MDSTCLYLVYFHSVDPKYIIGTKLKLLPGLDLKAKYPKRIKILDFNVIEDCGVQLIFLTATSSQK